MTRPDGDGLNSWGLIFVFETPELGETNVAGGIEAVGTVRGWWLYVINTQEEYERRWESTVP